MHCLTLSLVLSVYYSGVMEELEANFGMNDHGLATLQQLSDNRKELYKGNYALPWKILKTMPYGTSEEALSVKETDHGAIALLVDEVNVEHLPNELWSML